jgi:hypothetical protein
MGDEMRKIVPLLRNTGSRVRTLIFWGEINPPKSLGPFLRLVFDLAALRLHSSSLPPRRLHVLIETLPPVYAGTGISTDSARGQEIQNPGDRKAVSKLFQPKPCQNFSLLPANWLFLRLSSAARLPWAQQRPLSFLAIPDPEVPAATIDCA